MTTQDHCSQFNYLMIKNLKTPGSKFISQFLDSLDDFSLAGLIRKKSLIFSNSRQQIWRNQQKLTANQDNSEIAACNFPFKFQNFFSEDILGINFEKKKNICTDDSEKSTSPSTPATTRQLTEVLGSSSKNPNRQLEGVSNQSHVLSPYELVLSSKNYSTPDFPLNLTG